MMFPTYPTLITSNIRCITFYVISVIINLTLANYFEGENIYDDYGDSYGEFQTNQKIQLYKRKNIIKIPEEDIMKFQNAEDLGRLYKTLGNPESNKNVPSSKISAEVQNKTPGIKVTTMIPAEDQNKTPRIKVTTMISAEAQNKTEGVLMDSAKQRRCNPELRTVSLGLQDSKDFTYYPSCIRIKQCSGCCINENLLHCKPTKTQKIFLKVVKYHLQSAHKSGSINTRAETVGGQSKTVKLKDGFEYVTIDEHLRCKCVCKMTKKNCDSEIHKYDPKSCSCLCKDAEKETKCVEYGTHFWDRETCSCFCRERLQCTSTEIFYHLNCSCVDARPAIGIEKRPVYDLLQVVQTHRKSFENRKNYFYYVPNKSCFIFIKPNCSLHDENCPRILRYRDLPVYFNILEFGFYGTNFPEEIYSQVPINDICYIKMEVTTVKQNDFLEIIYISWNECKFISNLCYHVLHHIELGFNFEENCLFISLAFNKEDTNKYVSIGVSDKCTVLGSAFYNWQYNIPIMQKECQYNSSPFTRMINFEIHQRRERKYPGVVMILPCSPGGYIVDPDTGRFLYGNKCEALFPNTKDGGRIEYLINYFFDGNEDFLFRKKEKKEENPNDDLRPLYINHNGKPLSYFLMKPKTSPNEEIKGKIRSSCQYVTQWNEDTLLLNNVLSQMPILEERNKKRIIGNHFRISHMNSFFDSDFSKVKEMRKKEKYKITEKYTYGRESIARTLEIKALQLLQLDKF